MASPIISTSANDARPPPSPSRKRKADQAVGQDTPVRRALADVSPNVSSQQAPAFLKKPLSGSPLKRSFTVAMDSGEGFMYLKRRKLSGDETLSELDSGKMSPSEGASFRPILQVTEGDTEPNTPEDLSSQGDDSSNERKSFSSLINYDASSQPLSNSVFKSVSHAEMLKLMLRVAMFKVRTGQIGVPFAELQVNCTLPNSLVEKGSAFDREAIDKAVEELRTEAQQRLPKKVPKLMSVPVLKPTAYSSRMIYETDFGSSPPLAGSANRSPELPVALAAKVETPQRDVRRVGSPPSSGEGVGRIREQELTSSVINGRVAEGLLGLRNAV